VIHCWLSFVIGCFPASVKIRQSGVGIEFFTGRPVYEALVLGHCFDDTSCPEFLHNPACPGLVDVDCLYSVIISVLCELTALKPFVVWSCVVHDCSAPRRSAESAAECDTCPNQHKHMHCSMGRYMPAFGTFPPRIAVVKRHLERFYLVLRASDTPCCRCNDGRFLYLPEESSNKYQSYRQSHPMLPL